MTRLNVAEETLAAQLQAAGIPYEREYRFAPPRRWRADFWISQGLEYDLLVEIDGGAFIAGRHSRGTGVEADCEKMSAAAILGYRVLRMTPRQVEDGRGLSWVRQALGLEDRANDAA